MNSAVIPSYSGQRLVTLTDFGTVYRSNGITSGEQGTLTVETSFSGLIEFLDNARLRYARNPHVASLIRVDFPDTTQRFLISLDK